MRSNAPRDLAALCVDAGSSAVVIFSYRVESPSLDELVALARTKRA